jgi:hypothetical protein
LHQFARPGNKSSRDQVYFEQSKESLRQTHSKKPCR